MKFRVVVHSPLIGFGIVELRCQTSERSSEIVLTKRLTLIWRSLVVFALQLLLLLRDKAELQTRSDPAGPLSTRTPLHSRCLKLEILEIQSCDRSRFCLDLELLVDVCCRPNPWVVHLLSVVLIWASANILDSSFTFFQRPCDSSGFEKPFQTLKFKGSQALIKLSAFWGLTHNVQVITKLMFYAFSLVLWVSSHLKPSDAQTHFISQRPHVFAYKWIFLVNICNLVKITSIYWSVLDAVHSHNYSPLQKTNKQTNTDF